MENNSESNDVDDRFRLHAGIIDIERTLAYCHNSYISCSEQRLTTFRYFIIFIVAMAYAFYELNEHNKQLHSYTFILLVSSLLITFAFYKLETRNQNIVKVTEEGCKEIEDFISIALKIELTKVAKEEKIKIMHQGSKCKSSFGREKFFNSYKRIIKFVFSIIFSIFYLMILRFLCQKLQTFNALNFIFFVVIYLIVYSCIFYREKKSIELKFLRKIRCILTEIYKMFFRKRILCCFYGISLKK